jgi:cytochrome c
MKFSLRRSFAVCVVPGLLLSVSLAYGQDVQAGRNAFAVCASCHSVDGSKKPAGPTLKGIVGSEAGKGEFALYSQAMRQSGITWTAAELDAYLAAPTKKLPGTTMFINVASEKQRRDLIAYLTTLR